MVGVERVPDQLPSAWKYNRINWHINSVARAGRRSSRTNHTHKTNQGCPIFSFTSKLEDPLAKPSRPRDDLGHAANISLAKTDVWFAKICELRVFGHPCKRQDTLAQSAIDNRQSIIGQGLYIVCIHRFPFFLSRGYCNYYSIRQTCWTSHHWSVCSLCMYVCIYIDWCNNRRKHPKNWCIYRTCSNNRQRRSGNKCRPWSRDGISLLAALQGQT